MNATIEPDADTAVGMTGRGRSYYTTESDAGRIRPQPCRAALTFTSEGQP